MFGTDRPSPPKLEDLHACTLTHDLVLVAEDGELTAHRCVVALESPVVERHCFGSIPPNTKDGKAIMQLPVVTEVRTTSDE